MKILLDNIIFSKTRHGGVSNYWYELSKYLNEVSENECLFFEDELAKDNFHRKLLQIQPEHVIKLHKKISFLNQLLPVNYNSDEKFILSGIGISHRSFVQDSYIFNYGITEDVPI